MSVPRPRPVPKYTVNSIVPETDFSPGAQTVPSQRVSFTTVDGISGSVLVPDTQINDLPAVQTMIEAKIMALTDIKNLGG